MKSDRMMRCIEIEIAIARHLNPRMNLIVPNVWWGFGLNYEADLVVVKPSGYAWEVEIKISVSDLKAEKNKRHAHNSNKFKRLYFAVPFKMQEQAQALIPERSGLFVVNDDLEVLLVKAPKVNRYAKKLRSDEIQKLQSLAAMRIWSLKEVILKKYVGEK